MQQRLTAGATATDSLRFCQNFQKKCGVLALATTQIEHLHVASAIDFGRLPEDGSFLVTQLVRGEGREGAVEEADRD